MLFVRYVRSNDSLYVFLFVLSDYFTFYGRIGLRLVVLASARRRRAYLDVTCLFFVSRL